MSPALPSYNISEIDSLFFDLFGFYPTKEGQSYERIIGAVLKILNPGTKIIWDERKRGEYDQNLYQIDVSVYAIDGESIMVEGKDHTKENVKVARPELDKVAGSLIELDFATGLFFSATDFTRDAKRKAMGSVINPKAKTISLYHLRPSTMGDDKGRLKQITFNFVSFVIDSTKTSMGPIIPKAAYDHITSIGISPNLTSNTFFHQNGRTLTCEGNLSDNGVVVGEYHFIKQVDKSFLELVHENNLSFSGSWPLDEGIIHFGDFSTSIDSINYIITYKLVKTPFDVTSTGKAILLVKSEDGEIDKLITDHQIRGITFLDTGEILFDGRNP
jgi:Restriction endonuclease